MLEVLSNGFNKAKDRLKGRIELTEENINDPLKDIRLSLLEADVNLTIIRKFPGSGKREKPWVKL